MILRAGLAGLCLSALAAAGAQALTVSVDFDAPQADYAPPAAPGGSVAVDDQFASLGLLIRDAKTGGAASVADLSAGGSDPWHLYGGGLDTRPVIDFLFADPADPSRPGFTDAFEILLTDAPSASLAVFDPDGDRVAEVAVSGEGGTTWCGSPAWGPSGGCG